eukprot:510535_1
MNARKMKRGRKKNKLKKKRMKKKINKPKLSSHTSGQVISDSIEIPAKYPNHGRVRCVQVQFWNTNEIVMALVPYDGGTDFVRLRENVLLERRKKRIHGLPIKYKIIKCGGCSMKALFKGKKEIPPC